MDLSDVLSGGSEYVKANKPRTPDMDRIMEITLQMKVTTSTDRAEHERRWRQRIEESVDFDSLAWQALNVGFDLYGVRSGLDLQELRNDSRRNLAFLKTVQAFYDGFLLGAQFQQRGGHRD